MKVLGAFPMSTFEKYLKWIWKF